MLAESGPEGQEKSVPETVDEHIPTLKEIEEAEGHGFREDCGIKKEKPEPSKTNSSTPTSEKESQ